MQSRKVEAQTLGKVFWQVWSASERDIFGELEMGPKLKFGRIAGFQQVTI